ncbi:MAG: MarR family winged helix-turn-helix transcriptional regulator [Desulfobulbus sp.]
MTEQNGGFKPDRGGDLADLFRRAFRMMVRCTHQTSSVSHAQQQVLALIRERGPITQANLLELLDVRSSSLSEILRKLENNGCIIRKRNEADKRGYILSINATSHERMQDLADPALGTSHNYFACLEEDEQQQLRALLSKMINNLVQKGQEERGGRNGHQRRLNGCGHGPGAKGRGRNCIDQPIRGRGKRKGGQENE